VALGALTRRLEGQGIVPILVGGCAMEVYTEGGYSTSDVDLALRHSDEVDSAFADLGFTKEGRFWVRIELELLFEAPAPEGLPGETAPRLELNVDGFRVVVLGIDDLLLDRLRGWVHWKSEEDGRWARRLVEIHRGNLDWGYLRTKAELDPGEASALETLRGNA